MQTSSLEYSPMFRHSIKADRYNSELHMFEMFGLDPHDDDESTGLIDPEFDGNINDGLFIIDDLFFS